MRKFFICLLLFFLKIVTCLLENSDDEAGMMKKTKILACIAISKARMVQDKKFFNDLVQTINEHMKINDGGNKVLSLCLVNCYSKISLEKAFEIITVMHSQGEIDSMTAENKKLLGLQDGQSSLNELDRESFVKDFQEINLVLKELNQENDNLKKQHEGKEKEPRQKPSKHEEAKNKPTAQPEDKSFILAFLTSYLKFWTSLFSNIFRYIEFDNYFGIAFLIVLAFLILNVLKSLCERKPRKKKIVENNNKSEVINEEPETHSKKDLIKED